MMGGWVGSGVFFLGTYFSIERAKEFCVSWRAWMNEEFAIPDLLRD
jgi:hypothetical protein